MENTIRIRHCVFPKQNNLGTSHKTRAGSLCDCLRLEVITLDFNQISMFMSLAQLGQFSEAAEKENISQSSFSKQIKALEEELGLKLFARTSKGTQLTHAGKAFYEFARISLDARRDLQRKLAEYTEAQNKTATVCVMPVMASYGIAELISDFHRDYPGYRIKIVEKNTREIVGLLAAGDFNLALLGTGLADLEKYDEHILDREPMVLAVAADSLLAGRESIALRELEDEPLIQLEESIGLNSIISKGFKEAGLEPKYSYSCSTVLSAVSMVREHLGSLLLTTRGLSIVDTRGLKLIRLEDELYGKLVLVTRREHEPNQAETAFRNFTLEWYKADE